MTQYNQATELVCKCNYAVNNDYQILQRETIMVEAHCTFVLYRVVNAT